MKKLKPCKCGSNKISVADFPSGIFCYCWDCSRHGPKRKKESDAIEAWNRWADKREKSDD
jgi:hypothetical protein